MRTPKLKTQSLKSRPFHSPKYAIRNSSGFAYIALLVFIIIIGISLGAAGKYWGNVMLREKEEELLYRGDQYRKAIDQYYSFGKQYPQSIADLLKDPRSPTGKRHLRKKYKDPISGEDFVEIRHTLYKRIIGVHSPSEKEPLKKADFSELYSGLAVTQQSDFPVGGNNFTDKMKYSEWQFISSIATGTTRR